MPVGRRLFGPEGLKVPTTDAFSEAEMAAAVAAVDALDDSGGTVEAGMLPSATGGFGAAEATSPEESVALRIALLGNVAGLENAERGADSGPAEAEAAGSHDFADADAAELAAADEAVHEVAAGVAEMEPEPRRTRKPIQREGVEGQSEEEAEAQALREALAMVLEGDTGAGTADVPAAGTEDVKATGQAVAEPADEAPAGAEPATETNTGPDSKNPKHGLFHRIRGS